MASVGNTVEIEVEHGQRLEVLDEALGVVVEDNTLVEQALRVEDFLQFAHHLVSLLAPLIFHKRSHVAAGTMLSLQRAVVLLDHQTCHVAHHLLVALHLALALETLVENEVVVALESMTIDAGITVAVVGDKLLQLDGGLGQALDGEGHILDEARGADGARTTHRWEDTRADGPVLAVNGGVFGELGRNIEAELAETLLNTVNLLEQLLVGDAFRLGQDGCQMVVVARSHTLNAACIYIFLILEVDGVVDRVERHIVEHLGTLHHQVLGTHLQVVVARGELLHGHHGLAALFHGEEVDHGRCLVGIVAERLHRHLREEGQRTLRPYHTVGHDVERIVVGQQRTDVQTGHILDAILLADAVGQLFVGTHAVAQVLYLLDKLRMRLAESLLALLVARIDHGTVGKYQSGADHHAVAIGMHAAVHARSIVADDSTHHSAADGSGIGREHTAERL